MPFQGTNASSNLAGDTKSHVGLRWYGSIRRMNYQGDLMQGFTGFTDDTIRFLGELTLNNEKAWFDQNRARYEKVWLEPAKLFVDALGRKLWGLVILRRRRELAVESLAFRDRRTVAVPSPSPFP